MADPERDYLREALGRYRQAKPAATTEELQAFAQKAQQRYRTAKSADPNLERNAMTVAAGAEQLPRQTVKEAKAENKARLLPETYRRENERSKSAITTLRQVAKSKRSIEKQLPPGSPLLDRLAGAAQVASEATGSGVGALISALGWGQRKVHQATAGTEDPEEWRRRMIESAEKGESIPKAAYVGAADVLGKFIDVPLSLAEEAGSAFLKAAQYQGQLEAESDLGLKHSAPPNFDLAGAPERVGANFKAPHGKGSALVMQVTSDPLTWVAGGLGGEAGVIRGQATRLAERTGIQGAAKAKFVERAAKAVEKLGGTPYLHRGLVGAYQKAGGTDLAEFAKVMGEGSTFAGKPSPLRVGASLMADKFGVDINPAEVVRKLSGNRVRLPEQLARRAVSEPIGFGVRAVQSAAAKAAGQKGVYQGPSHARTFVEREAIKSKHRAVEMIQQAQRLYETEVAPLAPASQERRRLLIDLVDPEIQRVGGRLQRTNPLPAGFVPTPAEVAWLQKQDEFFEGVGEAMSRAGVIAKLETNPLTGYYTPRVFERGGGDWRNRLQGWLDKQFAPHFAAYNPTIERTAAGQAPAGMRRELDPHEFIPQYVNRSARAIETSRYKKVIERALGPNAPPEAFARIDRAFAGGRIPVLDAALGMFKEGQLLAVPRFHIINTIDDTTRMTASGMRDHRRFGQAASVFDLAPSAPVIRAPSGKIYTAGEIRQMALDNGYLESGLPHDLQFRTSIPGRFNEAAEKAAAERGQGFSKPRRMWNRFKEDKSGTAIEAIKDVTTLGARRPGRLWSAKWHRDSRTALLIDRLAKGDSPNTAAKFVQSVLYNPSDMPTGLRAARRFVPFIGYQAHALSSVPQIIARNPGMATAPIKAAQIYLGDQTTNKDEAPTFVSERGPTLNLGVGPAAKMRAAQDAVTSLVSALTGTKSAPVDPGLGTTVLERGTIPEGLAVPLELAVQGNWQPLAMMLGPPYSAVVESAFGKNLVTKKDQPPLSLLTTEPTLLPYSVGPARFQAHTREGANLLQYLAPLLGQWGVAEMNLAGRAAGLEAPLVGGQRVYSEDENQRIAADLISKVLAYPPYQTSAMTAQQNAARRPAVKEAAGVKAAAKRAEKQRKKLAR